MRDAPMMMMMVMVMMICIANIEIVPLSLFLSERELRKENPYLYINQLE
jgi:hypothetical protein